MTFIVQLLSALCGSFGFALIFGLRGKSVFYATIGGMLTWGVYLIGASFGENLFLMEPSCRRFCRFLLGNHGTRVQNAFDILSRAKHHSACAGWFAVLYASLFNR